MSSRTRKFLLALLSPLMCCGVLYGIVSENRRYLKAEDFEPYHKRAKSAIESIPTIVGAWNGIDADQDIPRQAQVLLKPNKLFCRRYSDMSLLSLTTPYRQATLLIVQCKQSEDMLGHYPRNCYPAQGHELVYAEPHDWKIGDFTIPGTEYQFTLNKGGQQVRTTVYNFLVIPNEGICRDMDAVREAAADYQQRYYGAAQFQVVFSAPANADLSKQERDEVFRTLMKPVVPVIKVLENGSLKPDRQAGR
jgi:hypothetical protein